MSAKKLLLESHFFVLRCHQIENVTLFQIFGTKLRLPLCLGLSRNDIEEQERNAINVDPFAGGGYLRTR